MIYNVQLIPGPLAPCAERGHRADARHGLQRMRSNGRTTSDASNRGQVVAAPAYLRL